MADESSTSGATPSGSDPGSGATPAGQQQTGSGARPEAGSTEGARPDTSLGDSGREALERERNARREAGRQLAEARQRITELEEAGKSEDEKRAGRLARAQADLDVANRRIAELEERDRQRDLADLKREIASEVGLSPKLAARLQGDDARSLRADAKAMKEELEAGTPVGDLGGGRGGTAAGTRGRVDMNTLIREAAGRG